MVIMIPICNNKINNNLHIMRSKCNNLWTKGTPQRINNNLSITNLRLNNKICLGLLMKCNNSNKNNSNNRNNSINHSIMNKVMIDLWSQLKTNNTMFNKMKSKRINNISKEQIFLKKKIMTNKSYLQLKIKDNI